MKPVILLFLATISCSVLALPAGQAAGFEQVLSMFLSLIAIVFIIITLAFAVKKLNPQLTSSDEFKVVRSINLGTKERLVVVEMDNKHHVLGVTNHAINYLYELEQPLPEKALPPLAKSMNQLFNQHSKKENQK